MILRAKYVLPMDGTTIERGEVLVRGAHIEAVGSALSSTRPDQDVVDFGSAVIMPGLVNVHTHIEYTLERYRADGLPLWEFLKQTSYRPNRLPDPNRLRESAMAGARELIAGGVTCIGDCSFTGVAAEAAAETGVRAVIYHELFGQSMGSDYPSVLKSRLSAIDALRSHSPDTIVQGVSPHSVYTSGLEMLEELNRLCLDRGLPISMHLAETRAEQRYTKLGTGPLATLRAALGYKPMTTGTSPFEVIKAAGLAREGVCFAHCVHLSRPEIAELAQSGAGIAHCPRSNAFLLSGTAPLDRFIRAGAAVGIGTDGAASCLTLDMFEETRFALGLLRARTRRKALTAAQALQMATLGGARALGLSDDIGTLEPCKKADLIVLDLGCDEDVHDAHLAALSATPAQVMRVFVDGREIWRR